jgi:hypothetical protein
MPDTVPLRVNVPAPLCGQNWIGLPRRSKQTPPGGARGGFRRPVTTFAYSPRLIRIYPEWDSVPFRRGVEEACIMLPCISRRMEAALDLDRRLG